VGELVGEQRLAGHAGHRLLGEPPIRIMPVEPIVTAYAPRCRLNSSANSPV